jgi:hypothetical protein
MDMMRFVNNSRATLEQGDVVVFADHLVTLFYGPNNEIPIPEIDITERVYDTRVCGIVSEVQAELKIERDASVYSPPEAKKGSRAKKTQVSQSDKPFQPQAFTVEELAILDRTKIESGQIGWLNTLGLYPHCKVDADIAPIKVGDLLTTSPPKGMRKKCLIRARLSAQSSVRQ